MKRIEVDSMGSTTRVVMRHAQSTGWLIGAAVIVAACLGSLVLLLVGRTPIAGLAAVPIGVISAMFLPYALFLLPWLASGEEVVDVSGGVLVVRERALGVTWSTRTYSADAVSDVRYEPVGNLNRKLGYAMVLDPGSIAFDHGTRSPRFGIWLDFEDAPPVVGALKTALVARAGSLLHEHALIAPPTTARVSFAQKRGGFEAKMPFGNSQASRRLVAVVSAGLVSGMVIMGLAFRALFAASGPMSGIGTAMLWTLAAASVIAIGMVALLQLTPVEVAAVRDGLLVLSTRPVVTTLVGTRKFDVRYLHNLRYEPPAPQKDDLAQLYTKYFKGDYGKIAFGYGAEQHRLGMALDGPEARLVADALNAELGKTPGAGSLAREAYDAVMQPPPEPGGAGLA